MNLTLKHLSPSQLNTFITNRPKWFAQKFLGNIPFSGSVNTARGHAVEAGIVSMIDQGDITTAIAAGIAEWNKQLIASAIPDDLDFKQTIAPLIKIGMEGNDDHEGYTEIVSRLGKPKTQEKIECKLEGCDIPIIGYLDFAFKKAIYDNKVSSKSPAKLSQDYVLQGSIYRYATGLPVYFFFEIPNKKPVIKAFKLTDEEYKFGLNLATKAAQAVQRILDVPIDMDTMKAVMFPNPDGGYGGNEQKQVCDLYKLGLYD